MIWKENLHEKMYNPWKDNYEPQNRERTESGYSSGSFAPYATPEGGAPYTPFEQYDSNSAIYSPSVQLWFYQKFEIIKANIYSVTSRNIFPDLLW